jgi:hypothetical protein
VSVGEWAAVVAVVLFGLALLAVFVGRVVLPWLRSDDWFKELMWVVEQVFGHFEAGEPVNGQIIVSIRDLYHSMPHKTTYDDLLEGANWLIHRGVLQLLLVTRDGPVPNGPPPSLLKVPARLPDPGEGYVCLSKELQDAETYGMLLIWDSSVANDWPWDFKHRPWPSE